MRLAGETALAHAERSEAEPGLVSIETSDTLCIDLEAARLARMRRSVVTTARLMTEALQVGGFRYRCAMLTLTYAPGQEYQARDVTALMKTIRAYLGRRGHKLHYQWVAELQVRGAVHYHIMLWLPRGVTLPKPDKAGWWVQGSTRIEWVRSAVGYLAKYASKGQDGVSMPKGLRMTGSGGLPATQRAKRAWWRAPAWVRDIWSSADRPRPAVGGGWVARASGEWRASPWVVVWIGDGQVIVERRGDYGSVQGEGVSG